jgi:pimeloyl-ACP methyl ester carboxylesterase
MSQLTLERVDPASERETVGPMPGPGQHPHPVLTLPDGRTLGYDDVGDPSGTPVVYLHGTPDSRLARHPDDGLAARAGVRLLAVDRPGYGHSSPATQKDFEDDLATLLDTHRIDQATILAWSGGALAALAAATAPALDGRITAVVLVAGVAPREAYDDPAVRAAAPERLGMIELADHLPEGELASTVAPLLAPYPCDHGLAAEHQSDQRSAEDHADLARVPGALEQTAAALVEAVRGGLAGVRADVHAQTQAGVVDPARVRVPIHLWYGARDQITPPAFGDWYAERMPQAKLRVTDGAGHYLFFTHWDDLLSSLPR